LRSRSKSDRKRVFPTLSISFTIDAALDEDAVDESVVMDMETRKIEDDP